MKDIWCDYDEAYSKVEAKDIGWCENCNILSCSKNTNKSSNTIKEFLIKDLINELGNSHGKSKRIRKIVEKYL